MSLQIPGYTILALAGEGTYSKVYRAVSKEEGLQVAIKVLDDDLAENSQELRYAFRLSEISSPFLTRILDFGETPDGSHFLVMEWGGTELYDWVQRKGLPAVRPAYRMIKDACEGVRQLHQERFLHLDIAPGNLFVGPDGRVRLADFGMCVALTGLRKKLDMRPRGTPGFTAPEVMRGEAHRTSDVYSLGALLHWLIAGRAPEGDDRSRDHKKIDADLPKTADWIIRKAIAPDPGHRFQTLAELGHYLNKAMDGWEGVPNSKPAAQSESSARREWWRWIPLLG